MNRYIAPLKVIVFLLCLVPLGQLYWGFRNDDLGANPLEFLIRSLGTWGLKFLFITLAVTPLRKLTGWNWLIRLRRMLGLYAFFYVCLHLLCYLWIDQEWVWADILHDILKRPFITVGMVAFLLLVPLAVTSNNFAIRKLRGKRWQALHRSVYVIAILGVLHYFWLVKLDVTKPIIYALILTGLLGIRIFWRYRDMRAQQAGSLAPPRKPSPSGRKVIPIVPHGPKGPNGSNGPKGPK